MLPNPTPTRFVGKVMMKMEENRIKKTSKTIIFLFCSEATLQLRMSIRLYVRMAATLRGKREFSDCFLLSSSDYFDADSCHLQVSLISIFL